VQLLAATPTATIAATDTSASEQGSDPGTFTITLSEAPSSDTTVTYTISGTARRGVDYTSIGASKTILAGQTTGTITITPVDDNIFEGDETVILTLASGTGYTVGSPNTATVTITDNDSAPVATIAATDSAATETAGNTGTFTITLSRQSSSNTTVNYTITGTATNGTDYNSIGTSVTILAGSTTGTITITPVDDNVYEGSETVILTLATGTGYSVDSPNSATVTINDNDSAPLATITATDATANETAGDTGSFTVTLSRSSGSNTTVNYSIGGTATNGTDYNTISNSVSIPAGSTTASITIIPVDDSISEYDETVVLTVTGGTGYSVGSPSSATVTILDNDPPLVMISATDSNASEGAGNTGTFTVSLSHTRGADIVVNYSIGGTATNVTDYNSIGTSVTIPAGFTTGTITITPIDDNIYEGSETVILTMATGTGYSVGSPNSATVTIADNESMPTATITATDGFANETAGDTGTFTITLSCPSIYSTTVNYYSMGSTATNGTDYNTIGTSVTIPAGSTTGTITITPIDDDIYEGSETVCLFLASGTGYSVGMPNSATVTIVDNESMPVATIAATDSSANETSGDTGTFTITLSCASTSNTYVYYTVSGTATSGSDFNSINSSVYFAAGSTTATITLSPYDDSIYEGNETVVLTLTSGSGYTVGSPNSATVTIADNESAPTATIYYGSGSSVSEGSTGSFVFYLSPASAFSTTVNYSIGGTAINGTDYSSIAGSITISPGLTSATLPISTIQDNIYEGDETITLTLTSGTGYTVGSMSSTTITIVDSPPTATITATDSTANETAGDTGTFTVSLSCPSTNSTTVNYYSMGGTATNGTDYNTIGTSVTIPAGSTTGTITITPIDDDIYEGSETVCLFLASGTGYSVGSPSSATVTIMDNESMPVATVVATDPTANETAGDTGTFTISLSHLSPSAITVYYTIGGTAIDGTDYSYINNYITIPSYTGTVTISPIDDNLYENFETVVLTLTGGSGYNIGSPNSATVTIVENDSPPIATITGNTSMYENGSSSGFYINLSRQSAYTTTVGYSIGGTASNGSDYSGPSGTVTISPGSTSCYTTITPMNDSVYEGTETIVLTLNQGSYYSVGSPDSLTISLYDDDPPPTATISASDSTANETGSDTGTFTVTLSRTSSSSTIVNYTIGGTATNETDYNSIGTSLTIPAGSTTGTVTITPIDDNIYEGSETVILTLASGTGYIVGSPSSATVTIADNDSAPVATIVATDATASETAGDTGTFTITLSRQSSVATYVIYTIGGTATNDYSTIGNSVTIPAGSTTGTVTITPVDDNVSEGGESVILTLGNGTGYSVGSPSSATVTIADKPLITWSNPAEIPYGTQLSASQLNATANVPGTFAYTPDVGTALDVGDSQDLSVTFTPNDSTNYSTVSKTVSINVVKATPQVTWDNPSGIVYPTPLSATQLNATASLPGTFEYSPSSGAILNVGVGQTLSVTFTPTDTTRYTTATASVSIDVAQAMPVITWGTPDDIVYGTALSETQLNATADVPGTFVYTPAAETVPQAGNAQTLSVSFTPTDTVNYSGASASVSINVAKATPVITWGNPADIYYGTALSETQLNATANVAGTFDYTPASDSVPDVGDQTLSTTISPTDSENYTSAQASVTITVQPNPAPVATDQQIVLQDVTSLTFALDASDPNGDPLTFYFSVEVTGAQPPSHGTLSVDGANVTYTPDEGFGGTDSFSYVVSDGISSTRATVTIRVNHRPVANNAWPSCDEDQSVCMIVSGYDPDGDSITYTITSGPYHGILTGSGQGITYVPAPDFNGTDYFTFTVSDGLATSEPATVEITVNPVNDPPVACDDAYVAEAGTTFTVAITGTSGMYGVLLNDYDIENDSLTAHDFSQPAHGVLTANSNGTFAYTPYPRYTGVDSFTYKANDGQADSNAATVTITVQDTTPPVITPPDDTVIRAMTVDGAWLYPPDWPEIAATDNVTVNPTITILDGGTAIPYPPQDTKFLPIGTASFTIIATDDAGNSSQATLNIVTRSDRLLVPDDIEVEATCPGGAYVSFAATVAQSGTIAFADANGNAVASGDLFPLGLTGVQATATYDSGGTEVRWFDISVVDTTAPVVTLAPPTDNITVTANRPGGADGVSYPAAAATDAVTVSPAIWFDPPSATIFPIGVTTVTANAIDDSGNTGTTTFTVTVVQSPLSVANNGPQDNSVGFDTAPLIAAHLGDSATGAGFISYTATLDGTLYASDSNVAVTSSGLEVSFAPSGDLAVGWHNVAITTTDDLGNTNTVHWNFFVAGQGITIFDVGPADGSTIAGSQPVISASFADSDAAIDPSTLSVTLVTSDNVSVPVFITYADATHFEGIPAEDLAAGTYSVNVSVSDLATPTNTASSGWSFCAPSGTAGLFGPATPVDTGHGSPPNGTMQGDPPNDPLQLTTFKGWYVLIREIAFTDTISLRSDYGQLYYNPQWRDGAETNSTDRQWPFAYAAGDTLKAQVVLFVARMFSGETIGIEGQGPDGLDIRGSVAVPEIPEGKDGAIVSVSVEAQAPFQANRVRFHWPMQITWSYSVLDAGGIEFEVTQHNAYITHAPRNGSPSECRTVTHLGCKAADQMNAEKPIVDAIWGVFGSRAVNTWDDRGPLTYHQTYDAITTDDLLANGDGTCGGWARFMRDCLKIQGINSVEIGINVEPPPPPRPSPPGRPNLAVTPEDLWVKSWDIPMPSDDNYPDAPIRLSEAPAQGGNDPHGVYHDHGLTIYGGKYYDPSYGKGPFGGLKAWQDDALTAVSYILTWTGETPVGTRSWNVRQWYTDAQLSGATYVREIPGSRE
jgi:hypothetical protein